METQTRKVKPPAWLVRLVEALIPSAHRDLIAGDLREQSLGGWQYLWFAASTIVGSLRGRMRDCFDVRLIAGEVSLLYVAFAGAPLLPLAIVLVTTLTALLARDAYIHPARGTAREAVSDAIAGATFLVLAQTFIGIAAPAMVMEGWVMARGTLIGMAMVSGWRMAFRLKPPNDAKRVRLDDQYEDTWRLNLLWMIGGMTLIWSNLEAVPAGGGGRDFLLTLLPLTAFSLAYGFRSRADIPLGKGLRPALLGLAGIPYKDELTVKRARLFGWERRGAGRLSWTAAFVDLSFALVAVPFLIAIWRWVSRDALAPGVDWSQVWINLAAFVLLLVLWRAIRDINLKTAHGIDAAINAEIDAVNAGDAAGRGE